MGREIPAEVRRKFDLDEGAQKTKKLGEKRASKDVPVAPIIMEIKKTTANITNATMNPTLDMEWRFMRIERLGAGKNNTALAASQSHRRKEGRSSEAIEAHKTNWR
jgi:hypothetical protein